MTLRRWKTVKAILLICVAVAVIVALSSWPLNRLPSSTTPVAPGLTLEGASAASRVQQTSNMAPTVAIIGSGLAGLSAAYEVSRALQAELPQAKVVIFEKNSVLGGNSAKASSGINAVNAAAGDSTQAYAADTTKSGGGFSNEELVATLAVSGLECFG
jgi:NADPH-dependent 2,4-dienoyl-CoA reductase/sulfur reductase-like enzyme